MSANLIINGVTYAFPATGDENWGDTVSAWAAAVSSSLLQKTGGTFTLSAEVDFGALFGVKALYWKSRGTNPATAGIGRFANNEFFNWRNAANDANLAFGVNASNQLTFDGAVVTTVASLSNNRAVVTDGTGTITTATTTATELGYVNGVTSAIQTQLNAKQATITVLAIANGGTNSSSALNNNRLMVSSSSAIVEAAAITSARVLISDANGLPVHSSVTSTELGYLSGVTSAIQTQLNAKQATAVAPTVQKFTSGSGTYARPSSPTPLYLRITMVGGGGGGGGDGAGVVGVDGGDSTFGTLVAGKGLGGGTGTADGGAGGSTTLTGGVGFGVSGQNGGNSFNANGTNALGLSGPGGNSFLGGAGQGSYNAAGKAARTNSGSGGSGGANAVTSFSGSGGGAGGYLNVIITSPSATYSYAVGGGGIGGAGVANNGGAGAAGLIVVEEFYQ